MERLQSTHLLDLRNDHVLGPVLLVGSRAHRLHCAVCVAGFALLGACQATNAHGDPNTGAFDVSTFRLLTETSLSVKGPNGTALDVTSSPDANVTTQFIKALMELVRGYLPPRLAAPDE